MIPFFWNWRQKFLEEFKEIVCVWKIFVFSKNANWHDLNNNGRIRTTSTTHLQAWIHCNWYTLHNNTPNNWQENASQIHALKIECFSMESGVYDHSFWCTSANPNLNLSLTLTISIKISFVGIPNIKRTQAYILMQ